MKPLGLFLFLFAAGLLGFCLLQNPLATELPTTKKLVVQCDDAGGHVDFNRGSIAALEGGIVKSVSLIVPGAAFAEIAEYARRHPEHSWGLHLTLTSEFGKLRWRPLLGSEVPSLTQEDGSFWRTEAEVLQHARLEEIERELRAQIERALAAQVPLSYLDSHMGVLYLRADLAWLLFRLSQEYQLPMLFARSSPDTETNRIALGESYQLLLSKLEELGNPIFDSIDLSNSSIPAEEKKQYFLSYFQKLKPGLSLLTLHCASDSAELRKLTTTASKRGADVQSFRDEQVKANLETRGIEVLGWRDLPTSPPAKPQ